MYKLFIRPFLFNFDPEKTHHFTFSLIRVLFKIPGITFLIRSFYSAEDKRLEREVMGLKFKNPVGLAAGFDKNAAIFNQLANFGFGFIEIGTITPKPQGGNPKKRLFRIVQDEGIINRMGFNNIGADEIVKNLKRKDGKIIIGGNIGKNTGVLSSQITEDYLNCFKTLFNFVDYFVVNVSCPNVGVTAQLQDKSYLIELLNRLQVENKAMLSAKPIVLKIAPDLNENQLNDIIEVITETKIEGVIACNTSTNRNNLKTSEQELTKIGQGGLSGKPITERSTGVIKYLSEKSKKAFTIIGVGGIHSSQDAFEKIEAGADLIQIYTGFIYEGPGLIRKINRRLLRK